VSGSGGRKSAARAEDGRFQPAADLRLSIVDLRSVPPRLWRLTNALTKVQKKALTHKDVKNEECSSEFFENKGARKVLLRS
jgi:hypothetical protein